MKVSDFEYIRSICDRNLREDANMERAQRLLRRFRELSDYRDDPNPIPMTVIERFLKKMVGKYMVFCANILAITDVRGQYTWHGGMYRQDGQKSTWMFTVHADDLYDYMVKLALMGFVAIREQKPDRRLEDD